MVSSRTLTALGGLVASVGISVFAYVYFDTLFVFLFVPFLPLLFRGLGRRERSRPRVERCPTCDFETRDSAVAYCPYDGSELEPTERPEK